MSANEDETEFSTDDEDEETESAVVEAEDTTSTESEPTSTGSFDDQHQEYLDEVMEKGRYDTEQEAIEFCIRYTASEKFDQ